ncbi:MAG: hypothetical protein ACJ75F_02780 [Flavisolibacter sp.]
MKKYIFPFSLLIVSLSVVAQDTPKSKEVNISSTFKPTLREAAKINFNASPQLTDTNRPRLQYDIPNQNLSLAFQPGSLKPLALQSDSGSKWTNENYFKFGYGNLRSPFAQAGISFGDGTNTGLTIYAKHSASKGNIPLQDYSNSAIEMNAFMKNSKNLEWNVRFGGLREDYNKYGFEPKTLSFPEDSTDVRFQTWRGRVAFHNINRTEFGLWYAPEIKIDIFNDKLSNSESNTYINLPLEKQFTSELGVKLSVTANLSRYKPNEKTPVVNNYFLFSPTLVFKRSNVNVLAGIRPSWDNKDFKVLPNVLTEFKTQDNKFSIQFGWIGYLKNVGFQYQAGINPWLWAPATVKNSRIEERYLGIKGSIGDHFSYSAKGGLNIVNNQPLFVNDTMSGKSFLTILESKMKVYNIGGELGYTMGEKLSVVSGITFNQFHLKDQVKAWGLLPLEWKTSLRYQLMKDLYLNSSLYAFDGPWSESKSGRHNIPAAMDLSAGLEFRIVKNVKIWTQFNNIFNKEYQRWNQYPVYGFNFLGGVVFSFAQKN